MKKTLTKEQKNLVAKNHDLIYGFMHMKHLNEDEYYDILALALCEAAMFYDESKGKFTTVAYQCMNSRIKDYWKYKTYNEVPIEMTVSYNVDVDDENNGTYLDTLSDHIFVDAEIMNKMMWYELMDILSEHEKKVVFLICMGLSQETISDYNKCTQQAVSKSIKQIRKKWMPYLSMITDKCR